MSTTYNYVFFNFKEYNTKGLKLNTYLLLSKYVY